MRNLLPRLSPPPRSPESQPGPQQNNTNHYTNARQTIRDAINSQLLQCGQFSQALPNGGEVHFDQMYATFRQSQSVPQQSFDASQGFHPMQAMNAPQAMYPAQSFDESQGMNMSQAMGNPQSMEDIQAQELETAQAIQGSWGGFTPNPNGQVFQSPFQIDYGLGNMGNGAADNSPSTEEDSAGPSPLTAQPGRNLSMSMLRQYLPTNSAYQDNVRQSVERDAHNQQLPNNTGLGQPEQQRRASENNNGSPQNLQPSQRSRFTIPQLSIPQQTLPQTRPAIAPAMGPLSSVVSVPARPKPGRKPLPQEDAVDRRRVQNRLAQRNFRDKRAQKVQELQEDNDRLRLEHQDHIKKTSNQIEQQRQENNRLKRKAETLEEELKAAVKRAEDAENKLHSMGSYKRFKDAGFPNPVLEATTTSASLPSITTNWRGPVSEYAASNSMMTPPEEGWPETDMTSFWTSRNPRRQSNANEDHGTQWLGSGMDVDHREDDGCGFCTDESNCSCLQSKKAETTIAPGGCEACIADPARAEACRALAAKTDFSPLPSSSEQRTDSMAPPPAPSEAARMMSCSKFIDRVETQGLGQRVPSISELFGGIASQSIHSYPSSSGAGAGYDVNEQEAAQVLQDMSRRPSTQSTRAPPS